MGRLARAARNDEIRMTKSERNPKSEARTFGRGGHGSAQWSRVPPASSFVAKSRTAGECVELAPAFRRPSPFDSGSKLHALHTLRAVRRRLRRARSAFTLAEVLAALAFMAIVIPVAIQGLRVAGQAGEVAIRKSQAARIADKIINQSMVTTNWSTSQQTGQTIEGTTPRFRSWRRTRKFRCG